jgi:hypothetical protein
LLFCSSEQRPAHGFDVFGRCWRCGCPRACTVPPVLCCLPWCGIRCPANGRERTAPEMAAKSAPLCPLIGGAADPLGVVCLPLGCVRCLVASASAWMVSRARPRPPDRAGAVRCCPGAVRWWPLPARWRDRVQPVPARARLPGVARWLGATHPDRCHPCGLLWRCPVPCRCWPCPCGVWWPSPAAEC